MTRSLRYTAVPKPKAPRKPKPGRAPAPWNPFTGLPLGPPLPTIADTIESTFGHEPIERLVELAAERGWYLTDTGSLAWRPPSGGEPPEIHEETHSGPMTHFLPVPPDPPGMERKRPGALEPYGPCRVCGSPSWVRDEVGPAHDCCLRPCRVCGFPTSNHVPGRGLVHPACEPRPDRADPHSCERCAVDQPSARIVSSTNEPTTAKAPPFELADALPLVALALRADALPLVDWLAPAIVDGLSVHERRATA